MIALLIAHAVVGVGVVVANDRIGRWGFAVAACAPAATLVWLISRSGVLLDGGVVEQNVEWVPALGLSIGLRLDAFGYVMVWLVSGIGLLVCVFAVGYFSHSASGTGRLAGLLTLFAGSMLGLVVSDHLLALFVFWELTSVTSYLLIGNDDRNPKAREAALMALLITGAGGLAMLAGFVVIGEVAGSYRLSVLALDPPVTGVASVGLVLVLVGAFTKSAQVPFAGWLPGAMVAPTPISAYLHAATMVKAGVYLVAVLSPMVHTVGLWRSVVLAVGAVTMLVGGWRALRQSDLKLLLAHGTVSQLGFMMMLFGAGTYDLAQAGVVVLIAHGAFKAALFMVVGIVDHQVGTRDVRHLDGFGPGWAGVRFVAVVAAASMAGLPPLLGFIAKEKAVGAASGGGFGGAFGVAAVVVAGSVLTVAYSGRFVLGVLGRLSDGSSARDPGSSSKTAPGPSLGFLAPAVVLAVFGLVFGLVPAIIDETVGAATLALYPSSLPATVKLWAGWNVAVALSALIVAAGAVLVAGRDVLSEAQTLVARWFGWVPSSDRVFWEIVNGLTRSATRLTSIIQNGSLPIYLAVILGVAALAPLVPAIGELDVWPTVVAEPVHVPLAGLIVTCALGATLVRRRIAAALMLGAVGYAMAGFYVSHGAPDLALTQFAVETLATVLFVLVLRFLPRRFDENRAAVTAPLRFGVSALVGASVFVLALVATGARADVAQRSVSTEMLARSVPDAKGSNVVNVILVDFRGLDTLGEITVLVVAALGAVALSRIAFRQPARSDGPIGSRVGFSRLPVVDASSRVLFASIVVLSLYFLFAGHNQPGGGFVGGLTAGAAISLRYVAGGVTSVRDSFRLRPWTILGGGLLVAVATALIPLAFGGSLLEHGAFERDIALLGTVKATSALPFDVGVYLVVVGVILMAFEAFGEDADPVDDPLEADLTERSSA